MKKKTNDFPESGQNSTRGGVARGEGRGLIIR